MADLDADLYGDLYETDFNDPNEKPTEDSTAVKTETSTSNPSKSTDSSSKPVPQSIDTSSSYLVPSQTTPIAPTIPATQSIPTYEEKTEYRDMSALQGYSNIAMSEQRPVRPSEMKDEG
ncbi:hypothetical protein D9758_004583 [Tetrapyrgos nigripes]|uniref:Uncharacterized protein n=1 Tax=Tetrapyrgos nigripes TaxID=182062 RepID=A0A8H5LYL4_9AGAR|nr:hypothetical protein D9758_004583 [Tetrapyrgos nigripes]